MEYETKLADGTSEVFKGSCWNCFQKSLGFLLGEQRKKGGANDCLGLDLGDEILPNYIIWIMISHYKGSLLNNHVFHGK